MDETENNNEGAAATSHVQVPQLQEQTCDEERNLNFDESPGHLQREDHNEGENQIPLQKKVLIYKFDFS